MKKVTAFVGSARKKYTYKAVEQFLNNLQAQGDVQTEIVMLSNYNLGICRGCQVCFSRGEEYCPLKDDRDVLMDKIAASDGVVFATPNYCFDMSGMMKVFLDRFGFAFHRPRYFGKAYTSIVTQGIGRGDKIVENFDFIGKVQGYNTVKGSCLTALDPITEKEQKKVDRILAEQSRRFYAVLARPANPAPSLFQLTIFRFGRTFIKQAAGKDSVDYQYYAGKGWLESDYYYPTQMGMFKKTAGRLLDSMTAAIRVMM
jgi:multimeric flavodoxin WrbA